MTPDTESAEPRDIRARGAAVATIIGVLVAIGGAAVLVGWSTDSVLLLSITASNAQMKANSALTFILLGIALALSARSVHVRVSRLLCGFALLVALLTLFENAFGISVGIDQLLVHDDGSAIATVAPGRMGVPTATGLTLLSFAIASIDVVWRRIVVAQVPAVIAAVIAFASLIGYLYGIPRAETLWVSERLTPMALHGAALILLLAIGVVVARPELGVVERVRADTPGSTLMRRLLAPAILLPLVVGYMLMHGEEHDLYSPSVGFVIFSTFLAVTLLLSIWLTAAAVDRAEVERREEAARSRAILETAVDAVITIDVMGKIIDVNPAMEEIFQMSRAELIGRDMAEKVMPERLRTDHRVGLVRVLNSPENFKPRRLVSTGMRADGTEFPVEISIGRPDDVSPPIFVGNIRDVSSQVRLESDLRQAQKMEAVGRLAGGIAHDFNNLLTVILGYADLAEDEIKQGRGSEELGFIIESADKATDLVRQLLAFSRQQVLAPEVLDLNEVTSAFLPMLEPLIGEDIIVRFQRGDAPLRVLVDRGQLEQVIVNLAINARDAMITGGELTLSVRPFHFELDHGGSGLNLEPGEYVCLTVQDTGVGIDQETSARIFEPFFTTKEVGHGTGLGLATVHGIVTQSGGDIQVYSEPGVGSSFTVYLPAAPATDSNAAEPRRPTVHHVGTERILVCEDDAAVGKLIERMLSGAGYDVLATSTPGDAIMVMEAHGSSIDALLTDVIMPEMSGPHLAARIMEMSDREHLPVLLVSGYTPETIRDRGSLPAGSAYVVKPFDRETLLSSLRKVLDQ